MEVESSPMNLANKFPFLNSENKLTIAFQSYLLMNVKTSSHLVKNYRNFTIRQELRKDQETSSKLTFHSEWDIGPTCHRLIYDFCQALFSAYMLPQAFPDSSVHQGNGLMQLSKQMPQAKHNSTKDPSMKSNSEEIPKMPLCHLLPTTYYPIHYLP